MKFSSLIGLLFISKSQLLLRKYDDRAGGPPNAPLTESKLLLKINTVLTFN